MRGLIVLLAFGLLSTLNSFAQTAIGDKAPDIVLISPEGKEVKLSSLKGKMVLIDFWASWCRPCRRENPNVVEAYAKYGKSKFKNAKRFEIYSVSLDRKKEPWIAAIEADNLTWKNHGYDEGNKTAKEYGVYSIPTAFLIDGNGFIVASGADVRGMQLHVQLDNQLKKKKKKK
ncbi:MAG: TlpA disulfide reductase family protein [Crocinitomicaceae bacterium]|nr:TlpA disulfide reductase family protein [Crocinitomicaceae bacterium]MDG1658623.1 TlpA disulfide reductase family protein [Crocinitomicaceae bacterium]MDG2441157.1 TlpA disulfide reductase family protein [Crocinitomicaceae bacterium]|tara:strand:+ start:2368 stop:2886 length:519 start_codon:yes stop_codon:yes gene_type:complete